MNFSLSGFSSIKRSQHGCIRQALCEHLTSPCPDAWVVPTGHCRARSKLGQDNRMSNTFRPHEIQPKGLT